MECHFLLREIFPIQGLNPHLLCWWVNSLPMSHQGKVKVLVANSCPTLCDLMDCSPPGSSVHGILYAKTLEWVAIPFSKGSSQPFGNKWSKKEKNISNLDKHYPVAFHKFCTNMYSHQQYRRGSFLSHIFAKSWYNHLLCLMLNFRVLSIGLGLVFCLFYEVGSLAILQTHSNLLSGPFKEQVLSQRSDFLGLETSSGLPSW